MKKSEAKAHCLDWLHMRHDQYGAIATQHGMTDTILWSINFKDGETTSNGMAPLKRRLRAQLNGLPLLMYGVLVPAGVDASHRHGHGVLFLPDGLREVLLASAKARSGNIQRSYHFRVPDPDKRGVAGWLEYCASSRNGMKIGAKFHATYGIERK